MPKLKKKAASLPYNLIMVEWEDSARPISAWQWVDEYEIPQIVKCLSVGFLIAETNEALALAPNLGDVTCERTQAAGIIRIPQSAVRSRVDFVPWSTSRRKRNVCPEAESPLRTNTTKSSPPPKPLKPLSRPAQC